MCIWEEPSIRFWRKVDKQGPIPAHWPELGPCWEWRAQLDHDGYGVFWSGERGVKAHVFSWQIVNGLIPKGLEPDHLCHNRACVNDLHLDLVTHRENLLRSPTTFCARNAAKTVCAKGHKYQGKNLKVTADGRACRICRNAAQRAYLKRKRVALGSHP